MNRDTIEIAIGYAVAQAVKEHLEKSPSAAAETKSSNRGTKIKGIRGLASYLEISSCTAQALKNKGKIPYYEIGNRVFFFTNEVDDAIWKGAVK